MHIECCALRSLPGGCLLFGEFSETVLFGFLRARDLRPQPTAFGWSVDLSEQRCFEGERKWLEWQALRLPVQRGGARAIDVAIMDDSVHQIVDELRRWPATELPPMQALKAIQRWQVRLQKLIPG